MGILEEGGTLGNDFERGMGLSKPFECSSGPVAEGGAIVYNTSDSRV